MSTETCRDFPRILTALRKEKGITQRAAAEALGISQALLSHYEKGVREPGLAFLVKAAGYYKVSTDYLLGRSYDRDGSMLNTEALYDGSLDGDALALQNRKLIVHSVSVLYGLLGRLGNRELILSVSNLFASELYALFRDLRRMDGANADSLFALPENRTQDGAALLTALQAMTEANTILQELKEAETHFPLNDERLKAEYPAMWQSLCQVLCRASSTVAQQLSHRTYDETEEGAEAEKSSDAFPVPTA